MTEKEIRRHNNIADFNLLGFLVFLLTCLGAIDNLWFLLSVIPAISCFYFYAKHSNIVWEWIEENRWRLR